MTDKPNKKRWGWKWPAVLAFLLFYALSFGPANFLASRGYLSRDPANLVTYAYYPLNLVGSVIPPFGALMRWYVGLWIRPH